MVGFKSTFNATTNSNTQDELTAGQQVEATKAVQAEYATWQEQRSAAITKTNITAECSSASDTGASLEHSAGEEWPTAVGHTDALDEALHTSKYSLCGPNVDEDVKTANSCSDICSGSSCSDKQVLEADLLNALIAAQGNGNFPSGGNGEAAGITIDFNQGHTKCPVSGSEHSHPVFFEHSRCRGSSFCAYLKATKKSPRLHNISDGHIHCR